jgi:hypothetical protein
MNKEGEKWDNIQREYFQTWINSHLSKRGLSVSDFQTDFVDGTLLIELLEIVSGKKIRYSKNPRFVVSSYVAKYLIVQFKSQKIDNISIALTFIEKHMNIKVGMYSHLQRKLTGGSWL